MMPGRLDAGRRTTFLDEYRDGGSAVLTGIVTAKGSGMVILRRTLGTQRILDFLSGEQLPRIC